MLIFCSSQVHATPKDVKNNLKRKKKKTARDIPAKDKNEKECSFKQESNSQCFVHTQTNLLQHLHYLELQCLRNALASIHGVPDNSGQPGKQFKPLALNIS